MINKKMNYGNLNTVTLNEQKVSLKNYTKKE